MVRTHRRELLLLRHGIAEERHEGLDDGSRALTAAGRERAALVLQRLLELDLRAEVLLSSPLVRARQTAELARDAGLAADLELEAGLAPEADPEPLLLRWLGPASPRPGWSRLALVGHEPDLSRLAAWLIGVPAAHAEGRLRLRKAGALLLQLPAEGELAEQALAGSARLLLLLSPKTLLAGR
ncbi:histidine phosphatase family protein [Synechococcus sp. GreenBA-s]|nr:histidine phosphatase family protein [Synechococcus sp. GreenBA-s]